VDGRPAALGAECRRALGRRVTRWGPARHAARNVRAVVLMESHRAPETRYFGARWLPALRAAGATPLALEAPLRRPLDRFMHTGIVRPDSEPYAFDPSRAAFLRTARPPPRGRRLRPPGGGCAALRRLMRRLAVDDEAANRQREHDMAATIVRRILRPHPDARVVVWTGEQHAMKRRPPDWPWPHPFMAAHIGEEPFCVWQECVDWPALSAPPRLLRGAHPRLEPPPATGDERARCDSRGQRKKATTRTCGV